MTERSSPFMIPGARTPMNERIVRIEGVDTEKERPLPLEIVDQVDPASDYARRRVVVLAVPVDRVPANHRAQAADLDGVGELGQQVALDRASGRGTLERLVEEAIGALRVTRARIIERSPEVGKARADQERVVGAVGGLDPGLAQYLGDDRVEIGDRDPPRTDGQALV